MTHEHRAGSETSLAVARRHVAEAEGLIAQQRILIEKMATSRDFNIAVAEQLLVTMETTLYVMQKHLQFEEHGHAQGWPPTPVMLRRSLHELPR